ncbi:ABC transporter permease [Streptomyces mutomycini]|uniref:ABC transporter permease n=1 Tax=Streptomyces mutomycini TaxID=284036 RepID=A0ABW0AYS5_9ACTN|nr:ABC transporter permease [Streptomyces mutomycini]
MSVLTPAPARDSLRGPARVVLRQHRLLLRIAGGLALATLIGLVALALRSSHVAEVFEASGCPVDGSDGNRPCMQTARNYLDSMSFYRSIFQGVAAFLTVLPALFSAFVAGPLIAREFETGTFRLSWTQSVSPTRWLTAKLAVPTVLVLAGTAVLASALRWTSSRTANPYPAEWHSWPLFATTGTVPFASLLSGLCLGTLAGLLIRRTVPALAVSAFATGAVITASAYFRRELWPTRTITGRSLDVRSNIWWVESGPVNSSGERLPPDLCSPAGSHGEWLRCMADHDVTSQYLDYHPASHFWPIQLVETGILLALAALALALAFRVLRRRTG